VATPIKVAGTVSEIIEHASDLRSFVIKPERRVPAFLPGQFLHLALDTYEAGSHWPDSRVFSIASSPLDRQTLKVTISRQGEFTSRMFDELREGGRVWLKLPYGTFCPNGDAPGRMVMFAGGSGITPFVSFLQWAAAAERNAQIDLHYGARSPDLLIYRSTIERCQDQGLHVRARYYVEQTIPEGSDALVTQGRLSVDPVWQELEEPRSCRYYLSGPRAMIDTFRKRLHDLGANPESVLSDDWS
jgi:ferredoxin-NADP reductase